MNVGGHKYLYEYISRGKSSNKFTNFGAEKEKIIE